MEHLNIKTGFWLSFLLLFIGAIFTFSFGYQLLLSHAKQDINHNFFATSQLVTYNIDNLFKLVSNSVRSLGQQYTYLYDTLPEMSEKEKNHWLEHHTVENDKAIHFQSYQTRVEPTFQDPYPSYLLFNNQQLHNDEVFKHLSIFSHMHAALRNANETLDFSWSYITTVNEMMAIYPYLPYDFIDEAYKPTKRHFYSAADFQNKQVGWEEPYMDLADDGMIITASYPIYSLNQSLLGVASQDITLSQLTTELFEKLNLYDGTLSFMMDKNGKAIANSVTEYLQEIYVVNEQQSETILHYRTDQGLKSLGNPQNQNSNYIFLNQIAESIIQSSNEKVINFQYFIQGRPYQVFATQTQTTDWHIISLIPEDVLYGTLKNSMLVMGLLIISVIALSYLIAARFLFNNIINPIEQLSQTAKQARDGNLDIISHISQKNEIGQLAMIFNQMIQNLKKSLYKIEQQNQELEYRIQSRTLQLEHKNQTLTALNREKSEFLAIAAHDLKNPLQAIQGSAELIEVSLHEEQFETKADVIEFASMINISAERMFDLITNLLDVNAIESGKLLVSLKQTDIFPTLQNIIDEYTKKAYAKNITVYFQPEQTLYSAYTDLHTVHQILDNLISNAVKYSPFGKQVFIRIFEHTTHIQVEVQDQGQGLSQADQAKLFGKFTRLSTKPTDGEHSTGLGLFIVQKLITALKGEVWCESELGQGATFIMTIPRDKAHI